MSVLIILFFFVLYGSFDAGRAEEEAQAERDGLRRR